MSDQNRKSIFSMFPNYESKLGDWQTEKKEKEIDNIKILSIDSKQLESTVDNEFSYTIKIVLSSALNKNRVELEVEGKILQTYQNSNVNELHIYYADLKILIPIPFLEKEYILIGRIIDLVNNKVIDNKQINLKIEEKIKKVNKVKDDCQTKFDKIAPIILKHEGGYVDDPEDKGGKTNKGIAWKTWLAYAKSDLNLEATIENLKNLTDEQAKIIYKKRYWEPKGFCIIENLKIALMFYDWTITSGGATKEFAKLLENDYDLSIETNSKFGENIAAAINNVKDQEKLLIDLTQLRKEYYKNLAYKTNKDGTFKKDEKGDLIKTSNFKFLKGWLNRVEDCLKIKL